MKPSLAHRLVGLCVLSTITIAAFHLKMVWWGLGLPTGQGSQALPFALILAVGAIAASVGSWTEKPWGYVLAILLCARENIAAVRDFYSQPAGFRLGDVFSVALSGIPVAVGMIAALVLLLVRDAEKETPQPSEPPHAP